MDNCDLTSLLINADDLPSHPRIFNMKCADHSARGVCCALTFEKPTDERKVLLFRAVFHSEFWIPFSTLQ